MLLEKDNSCLVLVDVQEKLTPHVMRPDLLVEGCQWLLKLAKELEVPVLISEQYPQGLGETVSALQGLSKSYECSSKVYFSCASDSDFKKSWKQLKCKQVVLMGIETHVCVLQTALELMQLGADVFVVADAVSCRHEQDHYFGLKRMQQAGINLVTKEMVFFEWLRKAGTPEFKALSKAFMK